MRSPESARAALMATYRFRQNVLGGAVTVRNGAVGRVAPTGEALGGILTHLGPASCAAKAGRPQRKGEPVIVLCTGYGWADPCVGQLSSPAMRAWTRRDCTCPAAPCVENSYTPFPAPAGTGSYVPDIAVGSSSGAKYASGVSEMRGNLCFASMAAEAGASPPVASFSWLMRSFDACSWESGNEKQQAFS
jgi:hypothetical protein